MDTTRRGLLTEVAALFGGIVVASCDPASGADRTVVFRAIHNPKFAHVLGKSCIVDADTQVQIDRALESVSKSPYTGTRHYDRWYVGYGYDPEANNFRFRFHAYNHPEGDDRKDATKFTINGFVALVEVDGPHTDYSLDTIAGYVFDAMTVDLANTLSVTIQRGTVELPTALNISIKDGIMVRQYPGHNDLTSTWERISK